MHFKTKDILINTNLVFIKYYLLKCLTKYMQELKLGILFIYTKTNNKSGTTCKVAIAKGNYSNIIEKTVIPTTDPHETVSKIADWLATKSISSLGVAAFGPLCLNSLDPKFGYVTSTPKIAWQFFNLRGELIKKLKEKTGKDFDVKIDTDVNSCAYLEYKMIPTKYFSNL